MTAPEFLTTLARSSAQAGVLALLILVVQAVFRRQLSPRWRCALWLLVVARLLVPVSLNSAASLFNLVPQLARPARPEPVERADTAARPTPSTADPISAPVGQLAELAPALPAPSRVSDPAYSPATTAPSLAPAPASEANRADSSRRSPAKAEALLAAPERSGGVTKMATPLNWPQLLLALWLAGTLSMLACLLLSTVVLARRFRSARRVDDPAIAALLLSAQHRVGLAATPLPIYECDRLGSPALYGCWRPRLLLPAGFAQKFSSAELGYIFLHELAHVKRRDLPVNWLLSLLTAVHWFNPLVWLAFARWRADRELACDALALEAAGPGHNTAYGQTILRLLEGFLPQPLTPGLVGILEDKRLLRQRISAIASFAPRRRWPVLALALTAALALVGLTDAQVAAPTAAAPTANKAAVVPSTSSPVSAQTSTTTPPVAPTTSAPTYQANLGGSFLTNGDLSDTAKFAGYDCFVTIDNTLQNLNVRIDKTTGELRDAGSVLYRRDTPPDVIGELQKMARLSEVAAGAFEVRSLRCSGVRGHPMYVFWLKSVSGGADLIYPFPRNMEPSDLLTEGKIYTMSEFVAVIRADRQK